MADIIENILNAITNIPLLTFVGLVGLCLLVLAIFGQLTTPKISLVLSSHQRTLSGVLGGLLLVIALALPFAPRLLPAPHRTGATTTPRANSLPSPALVQHKLQTLSTSLNAVHFDQQVTRGDVLVVAMTQFEGAVSSITDNENDAYILINSEVANPQEQQDLVELYYAQNATGGPTTVTVTFSPPADPEDAGSNVAIYEYRGLSTTSPLSDAATATSNNQLTEILTERVLTTTKSDEMCFAVGVDSGPQNNPTTIDNTVSKGEGYTLEDLQSDSQQQERFYTEDALVPAGGCRPNFSIAYPSYWAIIGAAFHP